MQKIFKIAYILFIMLSFIIFILLVGEIRSVGYSKHTFKNSFIVKGDYFVVSDTNMVKGKFLKRKNPNEFRIFVLGGSQAMGSPYVNPQFETIATLFNLFTIPNKGGISTWLEEYFKIIYPQKEITVVNAAASWQDLQYVFRVFQEIIEIGHPDLIIILSGNNQRNAPELKDSWTIENKMTFNSVLKLLTDDFAITVKEIIKASKGEIFELYFLTVPTNLRDWIPTNLTKQIDFDLNYINNLISKQKYDKALSFLKNGKWEDNSLKLFYIAKCYYELGDFELARENYMKAKDLDETFYRSRSIWNNIIRSVEEPSIEIIDMEKIMSAYSKNNIPGNDLFIDYCHLTLSGYNTMAYEIVKAYINDHNLESGLNHQFEKVKLNIWNPWQLKILYTIKTMKWVRLKYFSTLKSIQNQNSENVIQNFKSASRKLSIIEEHYNLINKNKEDTLLIISP